METADFCSSVFGKADLNGWDDIGDALDFSVIPRSHGHEVASSQRHNLASTCNMFDGEPVHTPQCLHLHSGFVWVLAHGCNDELYCAA
jgi:hypothetical protein